MESKNIKITNLFLDVENYRFEKQNSQLEAIVKMIYTAKEKLFNLAEDILNVGMNPTDKPLVIKGTEDNQYIVLEGNRRLTSLKLLCNPDLIPDDFASLRKKFIKLRAERQKNIPLYIDCEVCADRMEADIWIKRKHAQGLNGIGVEQWNSQLNPAKRNVLDLKNETCKNREKRNVLKISHTRHFKTTKKQSKTGCFYSF